MQELIHRLRHEVAAHGLRMDELEAFELLAAECSACCSSYGGGNKECPPKKISG